ncbi:MAG: transcription factor S [Halococcoides sp.]
MQFCDDCGSMMKAEDGVWVCSSCGAEQARGDDDGMVTTTDQEDSEIVDTSEVDEEVGPTTDADCPECDNDRARWELKQIRAADESETRFFTCTKCGHKWREDDH